MVEIRGFLTGNPTAGSRMRGNDGYARVSLRGTTGAQYRDALGRGLRTTPAEVSLHLTHDLTRRFLHLPLRPLPRLRPGVVLAARDKAHAPSLMTDKLTHRELPRYDGKLLSVPGCPRCFGERLVEIEAGRRLSPRRKSRRGFVFSSDDCLAKVKELSSASEAV